MVRLSGRTEDGLTEQLIWRTIGPHPANDRRRRAVLRWAGLRGPYVITQDIADEHHVSRQRVSQWVIDPRGRWTILINLPASSSTTH